MDTYSSGEDLVAKTRKPYTITKQRERWTDEEHNRFLEALKLYGRAWQRIEEHIGTKTAVQIRSHAQKFFSKLEKEALVKGIPIGQAIDIEIPPPRPKRKPNNPYPRKNGAVIASTTQVGVKDGKLETSGSSQQVLDLEKEPIPERSSIDGGAGNDLCSEFTMYQETPPTIPSKAETKDSCNFTEFIPVVQKDKSSESHLSDGVVAMDVVQNNGTENEMQGGKNFPRHVPVHILDGSGSQAISSDVSFQETAYQQQMGPALFANPAGTDSQHNKLGSFHPPFHPFGGTQEDYASLLETSSAFSSLIVSTLVQNPAAHAAAIFAAASFWPPPCTNNAETSTESYYPTPGMAAIAAATIAAATAWWAAHGLLPAYHHAGFTCPSATAAANACHPAPMDVERQDDSNNNNIQNCSTQQQQQQQQLDSIQNSELKSPTTPSSSDSGQQSCPKGNNDHDNNNNNNNHPAAAAVQHKDSNKNKNVKLVDRSSCGSNSSSETDVLEKHEEENKEADPDQAAGEFSIRRSKNTSSSFNDSWKEVSEGGRMAFKALFLREILPQNFSPPQDIKIEAEQKREAGNEGTSLDLNSSNITESCSSRHETENRMADEEEIIEAEEEEGLLTIGLSQVETRRTGFKPYKRCSWETRIMPNSATTQDQDKCTKRLRLGDPPLS